MRWQPEFWLHHRPIKTSHAETRPRNMRALGPDFNTRVDFNVKNFQLYGALRRTRTEVKNTLPTVMTIQTEKTLLSFEEQKKKNPYDVDYSDLYRCLSASTAPSPSGTSMAGKFRVDNGNERSSSTLAPPGLPQPPSSSH